MKQFPVFRTQRASTRRKAFSVSLRTQLFEVCVCFPERGRPLFASGSANSFEKEKEIKAIIEFSHQEKGKEKFWCGGQKQGMKSGQRNSVLFATPVHCPLVQFSPLLFRASARPGPVRADRGQ